MYKGVGIGEAEGRGHVDLFNVDQAPRQRAGQARMDNGSAETMEICLFNASIITFVFTDQSYLGLVHLLFISVIRLKLNDCRYYVRQYMAISLAPCMWSGTQYMLNKYLLNR